MSALDPVCTRELVRELIKQAKLVGNQELLIRAADYIQSTLPPEPKPPSPEYIAAEEYRNWIASPPSNGASLDIRIINTIHQAGYEIVLRDEAHQKFKAHTEDVELFLRDMYAIMVDPIENGPTNVAEMCDALLAAAQNQRERANTHVVPHHQRRDKDGWGVCDICCESEMQNAHLEDEVEKYKQLAEAHVVEIPELDDETINAMLDAMHGYDKPWGAGWVPEKRQSMRRAVSALREHLRKRESAK